MQEQDSANPRVFQNIIDDKGRKTLTLIHGDQKEKICGELEVIGKARDNSGNNWSVVVDMVDQDTNKKRILIKQCDLIGDPQIVVRQLVDKGLFVFGGRDKQRLLLDYLNRSNMERLTIVDRTGWHNGSFVMSDKVHGNGKFILSSSQETHETNGTTDEWRDNVASLCATNPRLIFAASIGFASPLLHLDSQDSGGFAFVGDTSIGKTKAAQICTSIWRKDLNSWRATGNGIEGVAAAHSDMGMSFDEIGESDPREIGETIYMLANGSGKTRASRSGSARDAKRWRLFFLSTGEKSLAEHVRDGGKKIKAGQEIRLAEIQADAGKGFGSFDDTQGFTGSQFADLISERTKLFYGAVGPAFVEYTVKNQDKLKASIPDYRQGFIDEACKPGDSGQVKRVAARFALVAMAGEYATDVGLTGWDKDSAWNAALICFYSWRNNWTDTGSREYDQAIKQVRAFIQRHDGRFQCVSDDRVPNNRAGLKFGDEYWIYPNVYSNEVCEGIRPQSVSKALIDACCLIRGKDGRTQARRTFNGKQQRFYVVDTSVLGDDAEIPKPF